MKPILNLDEVHCDPLSHGDKFEALDGPIGMHVPAGQTQIH